jgi:2-oxoglutarate ferredoxin oxidoreductase subunit alpha
MVEKRLLKKLPQIAEEIAPPFLYGDHDPEVVVACWGSTFGVLKEAVDALGGKVRIAMLHFSEVYPLPGTKDLDWLGLLRRARTTLCLEQNATGQFERLVRTETGFAFSGHIRKYDGRPFIVEELTGEINGHLG